MTIESPADPLHIETPAPEILSGAAAEPVPDTAHEPISNRLKPWHLAVGAGGLVLVAIVVGAVASSAGPTPLDEAFTSCDLASGATLGDDGHTLAFDHKGDEDASGMDITELACVLVAVEVPTAVSSHMDQTTSMDGRQTETWADYTISWSYHPDRGMDGVITLD